MPTTTVPLEALIAGTTAFVDPWAILDLAPTGLQVRGRPDGEPIAVRRVALAVSTTLAVIDQAAAWGAELLLCHHGMFWGTTRPGYAAGADPARLWDQRRVDRLREHGLSLAAYHLPLDAHAEVGNNVEIARRLGLRVEAGDIGPWPGTRATLGVRAVATPPVSAAELGARAAAITGTDPVVIAGRPEGIERVGIVSGGATRLVYDLIDRGSDAFVSGEGELWAYNLVREAGLTLVVLGHHRSERFGVMALGRWLERRFGVETRFFDEDNPF